MTPGADARNTPELEQLEQLEQLELKEGSPEELMQLYAARGWGDGLPLVAPTEERVDAMLGEPSALASGAADEVIAVLPPRLGRATRRVIAINAVLAGCPPGVLPVLVSAVRARPDASRSRMPASRSGSLMPRVRVPE